MVVREGRVLGEGEVFPIEDEKKTILTYGEVRNGGKMWVNVSKLEQLTGSRWPDFYRLNGTKQLIQVLATRLGNPQGSSKLEFVDNSRCQYQKPDKHIYKGTWVLVDLAAAFMEHVDKSFHARWCNIIGKTYSGDHSAVADVLNETDSAAGTESVGSIATRPKRVTQPGTAVGVKRPRVELGPTDFKFWTNKKLGKSPEEALQLMRQAAAVHMELAVANNPEAVAAVKRAEEAERICDARATEVERAEAAKRDTITREEEEKRETARRLYEHSLAAQAALHHVDSNFYLVKQLNWERTESAKTGPCLYFSIRRNYILYGQTGISFNKRYGDGKLDDEIIEGRMLILPAQDAEDAKILERAWSRIIAGLAIRRGKRERFVGDWEPFVSAVTQWNKDYSGRPDLAIVLPAMPTFS